MANITYGRCTNKLRCSLAHNGEAVYMPLDGRCPECGQPLVPNVSARRLKLLPLVAAAALFGAGGYYAKTRFLDPRGSRDPNNPASPGDTGSDPGSFGSRPATGPGGTMPVDDAPPPGGAVAKPNFDTARADNAKARQDVLDRIDRMPNLTSAQKTKLTTSVDKARGMGCILIIPFNAGQATLAAREGDLLLKAIQSPTIQKLVEDPTLVLVVLGYADKKGDPRSNLQASVARAESVQNAMKDKGGILNVIYSVGMGGSDLFDPQIEAKNRRVEVWAVFP